jgi:hypothetical protein
MKTIHKYVLDINAPRVEMPARGRCKILLVANQPARMSDTMIAIWVEVENGERLVQRDFQVFGTGFTLPDDGLEHVGSAICGAFVWHVYERA